MRSSATGSFLDRASRDKGANLIASWREGQITNDLFEDAFPNSTRDPAVRHAYLDAWGTYSDLRQHKAVGRYALDPDTRALLRRWELLLKSDFPYDWPPPPPNRISVHDSIIPIAFIVVITAVLGAGFATSISPAAGALFIAIALAAIVAGVARWWPMRRRRRSGWAAWMATGDARFYPFQSGDDLRAAGGDHSLATDLPECPLCGYSLNGLSQPGCPECGLGRANA